MAGRATRTARTWAGRALFVAVSSAAVGAGGVAAGREASQRLDEGAVDAVSSAVLRRPTLARPGRAGPPPSPVVAEHEVEAHLILGSGLLGPRPYSRMQTAARERHGLVAGSEVPQRGAEGDADADGDRESGGAENGGYDARERSTSAAESPVGAAAAASGGPHGDAAAVQPEVEDTDVSADDPVFSDHSPVVLTGPRGCGKSTLIARLLHALPDVPAAVIPLHAGHPSPDGVIVDFVESALRAQAPWLYWFAHRVGQRSRVAPAAARHVLHRALRQAASRGGCDPLVVVDSGDVDLPVCLAAELDGGGATATWLKQLTAAGVRVLVVGRETTMLSYAAAAVGDEGKICHVRHGDWDKAGVASFVSQWAARSSMAGRWNEADPERSAQMAEGQSTPTAERHADSDDDAAVDERDFVDNKVWEATGGRVSDLVWLLCEAERLLCSGAAEAEAHVDSGELVVVSPRSRALVQASDRLVHLYARRIRLHMDASDVEAEGQATAHAGDPSADCFSLDAVSTDAAIDDSCLSSLDAERGLAWACLRLFSVDASATFLGTSDVSASGTAGSAGSANYVPLPSFLRVMPEPSQPRIEALFRKGWLEFVPAAVGRDGKDARTDIAVTFPRWHFRFGNSDLRAVSVRPAAARAVAELVGNGSAMEELDTLASLQQVDGDRRKLVSDRADLQEDLRRFNEMEAAVEKKVAGLDQAQANLARIEVDRRARLLDSQVRELEQREQAIDMVESHLRDRLETIRHQLEEPQASHSDRSERVESDAGGR